MTLPAPPRTLESLFSALDRIDRILASDAPEAAAALVEAYDGELRSFMDSEAGRNASSQTMQQLLERQQAISDRADTLCDKSRQRQSRLNLGGKAARAYLSQGRG
ncbi:MAG TPA: hypothetical protein DCM36_00260 [Xanthomonadaceae bacterium]|nr:hypothetical protein [Xanthomonadaceae bacterium]